MFKPTLRKKLIFFSVLIALIPLGIAGNNMITITRDELKSKANDDIATAAEQVANEIDALYKDTWLAPLILIRNAIENEKLGTNEKVALMTDGISNIGDVVALQLSVDNTDISVLVKKEDFSKRLEAIKPDLVNKLKVPSEKVTEWKKGHGHDPFVSDITIIPEADVWLLTMIVPLKIEILKGYTASLTARINLDRIKQRANNPMITIVDTMGVNIFDKDRTKLTQLKIVEQACNLLSSGSRAAAVAPYIRPSGEKMLGAYAFPIYFEWAVIAERKEADAYLAVAKMSASLTRWVAFGLLLSVVGAIYFSLRISRPIITIGRIAEEVGQGNLQIRVPDLKVHDEIGELAARMNTMITGLYERFHLEKFVSTGTLDAIKKSDTEEGVKLGGERKTVTVFFSDIRGFTSFSEKVEPEVVIEMLNTYLRAQAQIVRKHSGDIDKYVGDELVAVFQGEDMVLNAALAAVEIQIEMARLNADHPEWNIGIGTGINHGDVIMGAMGSEERMDYTILGDTVNLGARLCSNAARGQTLLTEATYKHIAKYDWIKAEKLEPIKVKGKTEPISLYNVASVDVEKMKKARSSKKA